MAVPRWTLLAATDGSEGAHAAFRFVAEVMPRESAVVRVLTVFPYGSDPHSASLVEPEDPRHDEAQQLIRSAVEQTQAGAIEIFEGAGHRVEAHHRFGNPADQIIAAVEEWRPDLVVMGRRGKGGAARLLLGSVSETVVRATRARVLVAP